MVYMSLTRFAGDFFIQSNTMCLRKRLEGVKEAKRHNVGRL